MFVWTIWDVLQILGMLLFAVVMLFFWIHHSLEEWKCKHQSGVTETSACDAICVQCGKNLGFIGAWREKNATTSTTAKT